MRPMSAQPVLEIQTVYHRNDPIILGVPPLGGGSDEMARYRAIMRSAMLKQELANAGVPDVAQVWCHEVGASRMLHGIAIKQRYPGHAKQVGVLSAKLRLYGVRMQNGGCRGRRHRRVEFRTTDVGDGNPLRPGHIDRYFATHAHQSGGPAAHSRATESEGFDQLAHGRRCDATL